MASTAVTTHSSEACQTSRFTDDREEVLAIGDDPRAARGAITGVVLGACLWGAILVLAGVIKL